MAAARLRGQLPLRHRHRLDPRDAGQPAQHQLHSLPQVRSIQYNVILCIVIWHIATNFIRLLKCGGRRNWAEGMGGGVGRVS